MAGKGEGFPYLGATLGGLDQGGAHLAFPLPNRPGKPAQLPGWVRCPQRPPPGPAGSRVVGGREEGGRTGEADSRRGALQDHMTGEGVVGIFPTHSALGSLPELPGQSPTLQSPIQAAMALGAQEGGQGRMGEAGRTGPPGPQEQERIGGHLPSLLGPRKPAGLPGWVAHLPRPEAPLGLSVMLSLSPMP